MGFVSPTEFVERKVQYPIVISGVLDLIKDDNGYGRHFVALRSAFPVVLQPNGHPHVTVTLPY